MPGPRAACSRSTLVTTVMGEVLPRFDAARAERRAAPPNETPHSDALKESIRRAVDEAVNKVLAEHPVSGG